jgi:uncharacterized protein (DUF1684 family)
MNKLLLILLSLIIIQSCSTPSPSEKLYQEEIQNWQRERIQKLKSKNGWLNLAGLFWLKEGQNTIGSDTSNSLIFPESAPPFIGEINMIGDSLSFMANNAIIVTADGQEVSSCMLTDDQKGKPILISTGDYAFYIIKRDSKYGIRLRWYQHPNIEALEHIPSFNISSKWRIKAKYIPFDTAKIFQIGTMIGGTEDYICPGLLKFKINLKTYQLYPSQSGKGFFIIFGDKTSGKETYAAGRFLYIDGPDKNNRVIIDFIKAYNPPCAFTPYATCPLPPLENILDVEIKAGEKGVHFGNE